MKPSTSKPELFQLMQNAERVGDDCENIVVAATAAAARVRETNQSVAIWRFQDGSEPLFITELHPEPVKA